ncbi:hypothetical protein Nepgr_001790 [Nepenthes gracilis]|uniref:AP2/ERF domain-containing protein n=1 Tax=Nepenthes gracilis TaxID=150966 RepID=A0AAD3P553_NEPGR|nr:hypothetical protein Nepgr_001790 [Nepenthes gracilis]
MASMNNWLGFSLSPQELPSQTHHQDRSQSTVVFNSDDISNAGDVSGDYFDLTSGTHPHHPSLNSFGIFEAFNRHNPSQDWNMNGLGMSPSSYRTTNSEQYMIMGNSCNGQEPKLENFLGGSHSLGEKNIAAYDNNNGDYIFAADATNPRTSSGGNVINVSMIKTWLRNQHTTIQPPVNKDCAGGGDGDGGGLTSVQMLSLSMRGTGSESATALPFLTATSGSDNGGGGDKEDSLSDYNNSDEKKQLSDSGNMVSSGGLDARSGAIEVETRKSIDTFGQRTSIYRGVTRHRWTGRYEAHLWDNSCRREGQTRKGRQGGYDKEEKAARAYDLAAIKYWGTATTTNFPITNYKKEIEEMKHLTRQEYIASLRRKSSGFSRGASIYRGVTRHHQHGRWQARIGRVAGNKDLYLGTFSTQEEAAEAYDTAAIKFRGLKAVTNFEMSRYDVKAILESSTLPIGGAAKRLKDVEDPSSNGQRSMAENYHHHGWPTIAFQQAHPLNTHYSYAQQHRLWCKQEQDPDSCFQGIHQLQLGNTHNFFQPNPAVDNLMSLDTSSMEHSSGSNSVIYSGDAADGCTDNYQGIGYGSGGGFLIPMATVVPHEGNGFGDNTEGKQLAYENMYCLSQQQNGGVLKPSAYDLGSSYSNWIPTAVPTAATRGNSTVLCHGAPNFAAWNHT